MKRNMLNRVLSLVLVLSMVMSFAVMPVGATEGEGGEPHVHTWVSGVCSDTTCNATCTHVDTEKTENVTASTCAAAGTKTVTCVCGTVISTETLVLAEHSYDEATGLCTGCGTQKPTEPQPEEQPAICTKDAECTAESHDAECPKHPDYVAPVTCDGSEDCQAVNHETTCALYDPCAVLGCTDEEHKEGCPYTIPCDTPGCEKHKGHLGECEGRDVFGTVIDTYAELKAALEAGGTVELGGDINDASIAWSITPAAGAVLNGNNHTITVANIYESNSKGVFHGAGSFAVNDLKINYTGSGFYAAFDMSNGGSLTNVTINGNFAWGVIAVSNLTVSGCTFGTGVQYGIYSSDDTNGTNVTISRNTFSGERAGLLRGTVSFENNTVASPKGVSVATTGSTFTGNTFTGERALSLSAPAQVSGNSFSAETCVESKVNADLSGNYWGSENGPSDAQLKTEGSGAITVNTFYPAVSGTSASGSLNMEGTPVLDDAVVAQIGTDGYFTTLQAAINAAQNGQTINLLKDCDEVVNVAENCGTGFTIDGATADGKVTYTGSIKIGGGKNLTVKNINFVHSNNTGDYSIYNAGGTGSNYNTTLLIDGCSFTGSGMAKAAVWTKHPTQVTIQNTTGTDLHSILQNVGGQSVALNKVKVTNSGRGVSMGTPKTITVTDCVFDVQKYGVRIDVTTYDRNVTISGGSITSAGVEGDMPIVLRKADGSGTNTITITGCTLNAPASGNWMNLEGSMPRLILTTTETVDTTAYAAKNGNTYYTHIADAVSALSTKGGTVSLLKDVTEDITITAPADKNAVIDLNDKTVSGAVTIDEDAAATIKGALEGNLTVNGTLKVNKDTGLEAAQLAIGAEGKVEVDATGLENDPITVYVGGVTAPEEAIKKVEVINGNAADGEIVDVIAQGNEVKMARLELPSATVTSCENEELNYALTFTADEPNAEQLAYFGNWKADFVLTINETTVLDFDRIEEDAVNGYLGGQFDGFGSEWLYVPTLGMDSATVKANEPLKIMEYAAGALNQSGLAVTYNDVYEGVKVFNCGVYLKDEFLAAHPNLKVNVQLMLYHPYKEDVSYSIGSGYTYEAPYVATIESTGERFGTLDAAVAAAPTGSTILIKEADTYELPVFTNKELTFKGADKDEVIINDAPNANVASWIGSTIHFENLTAAGADANYHGLAYANTVTYMDCNVNNLRFLYAQNVSFDNCDFNSNGREHSFWTYGASNITVSDSTFNYTDRAVNCYSEKGAAHEANVTFTNCTFNSTNSSSEGAVEINSGSVKSIHVTMSGCTAPQNGKMWFNSTYDTNKGANTIVDVNGERVWPIYPAYIDANNNGKCDANETGYATVEEAIKAEIAAGQKIVVINSNADVAGVYDVAGDVTISYNGNSILMPNGGKLTFDANGTAKIEPKYDSTKGYGHAVISHVLTNGRTTDTFLVSKENAYLTQDKNGALTAVITKDVNGKELGEVTVLNKIGNPYNLTPKENKNTYVQSSTSTLTFTSNMFFETFKELRVTNSKGVTKTLTLGTDYTAKKGSTIITLSNAYLRSLLAGTYTMTLVGHDNLIAQSNFHISVNYYADATNPKTGDDIFAPAALMLFSVSALAVLMLNKKRIF